MRYLLLFVLVLLLSGCGLFSKKDTIVVKETTVKLIETPSVLLMPCAVAQPPDRNGYIKPGNPVRESLLATYTTDLLADLRLCNAQIEKIKDFQAKEKLNSSGAAK